MLALRIDYLTGRCVATAYNDRSQAEWPPHPARVYSALVATWHAHGAPEDQGAALRWLEAQGPPRLVASGASHRSVLTHYVPVNDAAVLRHAVLHKAQLLIDETEEALSQATDPKAIKKLQRQLATRKRALVEKGKKQATNPGGADNHGVLPGQRTRQARTFPSVTPEEPTVHMVWPEAAPASVRAPLDALARGLVRLGHSSSLVSARLVDQVPEPNWHPDPEGEHTLRVPEAGQLDRLDHAFAHHQAVEPRVLPCRMVTYRRGRAAHQAPVPCSRMSDSWIVLKQIDGPRLGNTQAVAVARAVRGALLKHGAPDGLPEVLSGHNEAGLSLDHHLAVWPLSFAAHERADGLIRGVALVLPREATPADQRRLLRAVGRWERVGAHPDERVPAVEVKLGRAGVLRLRRQVAGVRPLRSLEERSWCRVSRRWISVTPVALGRNPGRLDATDTAKREKAEAHARQTLTQSCLRLGLPAPAHIALRYDAPVRGAAPLREVPAYPPGPGQAHGPRRVKVHVELLFEEPVRGPVALGAGRHFGLGLFKPITEEAGS